MVQVCSGQVGGDPSPQSSTQTVLYPALLPLLHGVGLVGRAEHRHTAAPENVETQQGVNVLHWGPTGPK